MELNCYEWNWEKLHCFGFLLETSSIISHFHNSQPTPRKSKFKINHLFRRFSKKNCMTCRTKKRKLLKHEFSKLQINTFLPRFPSTHFLFLPEFAWETKLCAPRECLRKSIFWFKIILIIDKYRYLWRIKGVFNVKLDFRKHSSLSFLNFIK